MTIRKEVRQENGNGAIRSINVHVLSHQCRVVEVRAHQRTEIMILTSGCLSCAQPRLIMNYFLLEDNDFPGMIVQTG